MSAPLTPLAAHAACAALVLADLAARTLRLRALAHGTGASLSLRDSFAINCYADAGSTLTPLRVGGEPARVAGMLAAGMRPTQVFVAIAFELLVAWPTLLVAGGALFLRFAPGWWRAAGPALQQSARASWPWVLAVAALSVIAAVWGRRLAAARGRRLARPWRRVRAHWRRMPAWVALASVPLTLVGIASRTALLPVLALTLPAPPETGTLLVGSFTLVYGQLVLPTPAGAGAVELGFLGGAAGALGGGAALLLAWRFWSSGASTLLGLLLAARAWRARRLTPPA